MTAKDTNRKRTLSQGCAASLGIFALSLLLMFSSAGFPHHPVSEEQNDLLACSGRFGVGLPLPFLCDYSSGSSPGPTTWGRIDPSDFPYFSPLGTVLDLLFYGSQLWLLWFIVRIVSERGEGPDRQKQARWVIRILIAYVIGFYCAAVLLQSVRFRVEETHPRTPTPIVYTPTPFGTPPPPDVTPIPTSR